MGDEGKIRALTFAVVGRGKVGQFPEQPAFIGVPAEAEKKSVRPKTL